MRAVLFDVDGVLIDSLPQHLDYCRDLARSWGLNDVVIPDRQAFRSMVDAGVKVSPMLAMFLAFGFPAERLGEAVDDYDRQFMTTHPPQAFVGVGLMLEQLSQMGLRLGLVTANIRANVVPVLSQEMPRFEPGLCHFFDSTPEPRTKAECLSQAIETLECASSDILYVGDQPGDAVAAASVGARFLAVAYGWGFVKEPRPPHAALSIRDIVTRVQTNQFSR